MSELLEETLKLKKKTKNEDIIITFSDHIILYVLSFLPIEEIIRN